MLKNRFSSIILISVISILMSCSKNPTQPTELTKYWKLKVKEIWWISPNDASAEYLNINKIPVGIDFPDANGTHHVYTGSERNITRTDTPINGSPATITCTWDSLPSQIEAGKNYSLYYKSIGTALKGIAISYPVRHDSNPTAWSILSMLDGEKSITFKMSEPSDSTPLDMKIVVRMTSGSYYYLDYVYIYEWVKN